MRKKRERDRGKRERERERVVGRQINKIIKKGMQSTDITEYTCIALINVNGMAIMDGLLHYTPKG